MHMKNTTAIFIRNPRQENQGFSLIEVLVSLLVLAIGLLGLAMLQTTGLHFTTNSYSRTQATYLAYDLAERMRANVTGFVAGNYDVNAAKAGLIASSIDYSCNQTHSCTCQSSSSTPTTCDPATLAKYDLGQWYYNLNQLLPGSADAKNLSTPIYSTVTRSGNAATITLMWMEKVPDASSTAPTAPVSQTWYLDIY